PAGTQNAQVLMMTARFDNDDQADEAAYWARHNVGTLGKYWYNDYTLGSAVRIFRTLPWAGQHTLYVTLHGLPEMAFGDLNLTPRIEYNAPTNPLHLANLVATSEAY